MNSTGTAARALLAVLLIGAGAVTGPAVQAQEPSGVEIIKNLEIPTRSGNVLRADLYLPVIAGDPADDLPTVVTYFPYVKDDESRFEVAAMRRFAQEGYAGLLVDIAGTGVSPGTFGFLDRREIADGRDVVDWAAAQPFSNGRVGMWGYSYPGVTAAHVAATQPPSLQAVVPASIFHDAYRDLVFPGGILTTQDGLLLPWIMGQTLLRQRPGTDPELALESALDSILTPGGLATLLEAPAHLTYDAYWQERALENKVDRITAPTLLWGGWSDVYPRGTLLNHRDIGADHVRLVMGPWGHLAGAQGEPLALFMEESIRWFDTFLRDDPAPADVAAVSGGARIFDVDWTGDGSYAGVWPGQFTELASWPPTTRELTYELCAGTGSLDLGAPWPIQGSLVADCRSSGELPVVNIPVDVTGGGSIGHDAVAHPGLNIVWDDKDQRVSLTSTALLTEPLGDDLILTGSMQLSLSATTVGVDADWVVRVVDIGPDGAQAIAPGWLRASRRHEATDRPYLWHTHDRSEPVAPMQRYDMNIEIWPTSYRLPAGHRLGILVRSADTLKVTPNLGSVASTILTGPGTVSALTVSARVDIDTAADPLPTEPETGGGQPGVDPSSSLAPAAVVPPVAGSSATLPATGGRALLGLAALLVALALAFGARARRLQLR